MKNERVIIGILCLLLIGLGIASGIFYTTQQDLTTQVQQLENDKNALTTEQETLRGRIKEMETTLNETTAAHAEKMGVLESIYLTGKAIIQDATVITATYTKWSDSEIGSAAETQLSEDFKRQQATFKKHINEYRALLLQNKALLETIEYPYDIEMESTDTLISAVQDMRDRIDEYENR